MKPKIRDRILVSIGAITFFTNYSWANPQDNNSVENKARMNTEKYEPSNTGINVRDRMNSVLPESQSSQKMYVDRTSAIRSELVKQLDLSTSAHNVKIITLDDGTTVLRGPVRSSKEKLAVESIAKKHSGNSEVKSFLEVDE